MARPFPDAEEQRRSPKARAEGIAGLARLSDEHLVAYADECKREAELATKDERQAWQDYFDLWDSKRSYEDKEEWQSKMIVEKPFTAVEQATSQIQRALLDSPEFLKAVGSASHLGVPAEFWENYLRLALEQAKFIPKFTDSVQVAFITGIGSYIKPRWNRFTVRSSQGPVPVSFLAFSNVLPWKIYRDPDSKTREQWSGMYLIHSDNVDLHRLEANPVYTNLEKLGPGSISGTSPETSAEGRDRDRNVQENKSKYRHAHLVDEFWGDVLDEDGHLVAPDVLFAKSGKVLIREPKPQPIMSYDTNTGRQRWPFISCSPFPHPMRFEGRGIIRQVYDLVLSYENGLNLGSDAMNWKVNNPSEFDASLLANPTDTKIVPGKGFARKVPVAGGSSINPLDFAKNISVPDILSFLEYIDKNIQNNSFINEFVVGLPGYRSDITKGEVQIKTAQSLAIFDRIGRVIELAGKDAVDLVYDMLVQYTDQTTVPIIGNALDPRILGALVQMTPEERYTHMRADLNLRFTGISQALQRADQLRRLMQLSVIAENPMFQGRVKNPSDLLRSMVELLGYSSKIEILDQPAMPPGMVPPGMVPGGGVPGANGGGVGGGGNGGPGAPGGGVRGTARVAPRGVGQPEDVMDEMGQEPLFRGPGS